MKKILIALLFIIFTANNALVAQECNNCLEKYKKPTFKEQREIDEMLDMRLNLSQEQKDYIKTKRQEHKKEMDNSIDKIKELHKKIRDVYITGIPKWQADLKTAHLKTELAITKQNIDKMKDDNRKNFENILDENQRIEFEKIKKEFSSLKEHPKH